MKRLQKFIGKSIDQEAVRDEKLLSALGVESRYVPVEIEDFDEMEFGLGQWGDDRTVIFTLVLEQGKLQRVSVGYIPEGGDEDDMHAFSEADLAAVMGEKGEALVSLFNGFFPGESSL